MATCCGAEADHTNPPVPPAELAALPRLIEVIASEAGNAWQPVPIQRHRSTAPRIDHCLLHLIYRTRSPYTRSQSNFASVPPCAVISATPAKPTPVSTSHQPNEVRRSAPRSCIPKPCQAVTDSVCGYSFLFHSLTKSESREGRSSSRDRGTSPGRGRSLSPFHRKKRDSSAEGVRKDSGGESEPESDSAPVIHPSNAFDDSDSDDEEEAAELYGSSDEELFKNTEVS